MRFLQALQRGSKLIRVDKLDVSRAAGSSDDPMETLTITATISGFALADASGAAPPDSASKRGQ
jgi:hypothetical protein